MKKPADNILKQLKGDQGGFKIPENYLENFSMGPDTVYGLPQKSDTGFVVPDGYFEQFESKLLETNQKSEPKSGFITPENYFENFRVKTGQENKQTKMRSLPGKFIFKIGYAAVAASILIFFVLNLPKESNSENLTELNTLDIESWVYENAAQFNTDEITEVFQQNELTLNSFDYDSEVNSYLSEKDIESMLIQEEP